MAMEFDKYRRSDGSIKLYEMFKAHPPNPDLSDHQYEACKMYFDAIENSHRIVSRQAAAIVFSTAALLAMIMDPRWK